MVGEPQPIPVGQEPPPMHGLPGATDRRRHVTRGTAKRRGSRLDGRRGTASPWSTPLLTSPYAGLTTGRNRRLAGALAGYEAGRTRARTRKPTWHGELG